MTPTKNIRDEARRIVDRLAEDATWDDLLREIEFRRAVEAGMEDSRSGRLVSTEEARRRLGLTS